MQGSTVLAQAQRLQEFAVCWFVVHVRAGRELATADLMQRNLQLEVFLPEVRQRWRGKMQLGPLFPGYLFVNAGSEEWRLAGVETTPGCGRLVRSGNPLTQTGDPVCVDGSILEQLKQHVEELNQVGGLPAHKLHPGDSVEITAGPLRGLIAIFQGPLTPSARVQVLLHFLGREQEVSVALDEVEPYGSPAVKRVRRTRGHGRKIHGR
jgi:transcriptional antiterminator RfaH